MTSFPADKKLSQRIPRPEDNVPHEPFRYPRCCVVIPCYNEENRLDFTRMEEFLRQYPDTGFFFVNDGSADNTKILLEKFSRKFPDRVSVMSFEKNRGKAEAVRQGVLCIGRGTGCEITGFWDADLSAPPEDMVKFREILRANPDLILAAGCRQKKCGANLKRRLFRRLSGNTASALIRLKLGYPVTDSQCGAKLFVLKEIQQYFREPFRTKWLFDAELFLRILRKESRAGMKKRVCEIPVTFWSDVPSSKVRPIQAGLQLFRFLFL